MTAEPTDVTVHEMSLRKEYFDLVVDGRKTTEIRVNDARRQKITKGALIRFRCLDEQVLTRVTRLSHYSTFEAMFDHEDVASINPLANRADQLASVRQVYPPEREALGVVAIGVELITPYQD